MNDFNQQDTEAPHLSKEERVSLLRKWNNTARNYPRQKCIHHLFKEQVHNNPNAVALLYEDKRLNYQELDAKSSQLANYLIKQGVDVKEMVGVCMDSAQSLLVAVLGILKAGGTYVPLDPSYPRERLAFMLEDSKATVVVTQSLLQERLPNQEVNKICLDSDWLEIGKLSAVAPKTTISSENLAYVIYTSGSTGIPKGVCVSHRAVNRLVCNTDYVDLGQDDVIAQASNTSFDAATFEIWGALLNGAKLVEIPRHTLLSPHELHVNLKKYGITTLFLTTALFNQLIQQLPSIFKGVKQVLFGGEQASPQWVRKALESGPPESLLHVYGPTENTTFSTWYRVMDVRDDEGTVPIGRPIANSRAYVLDENLQPTPAGKIGELYVAGDGVASGYLDRPELTGERFILDPFGNNPGARMYKTGDLAHYLPDGDIEFIGRIDNQVKLRGFRIELGEIETKLEMHPEVSSAVVILRNDMPGGRQLVAYIVPLAEKSPDASVLRLDLAGKLPEYMLPSVIMMIDVLPLTPNGKLDRQALPRPDDKYMAPTQNYVPPETEIEKRLAVLWQEILGVRKVGICDNFIELGGYSLLSTQLLARLYDEFNLDISFKEFYAHPTITEISERLKDNGGKKSSHDIPPLHPVPRNGEDYPVTSPQERVMFLTSLVEDSIAYNAQMTFHFTGKLNTLVLEQALTEIVRRHEILRTSFHMHRGNARQRIHEPWKVEITVQDYESFKSELRRELACQDIEREIRCQFDMTTLPLVRWKLFKLSPDNYVLTHVEHHLVHDGWSFARFVQEFKALYTAYSAGQASPLADLPVQFADYATWQKIWLQGEALDALLKYWCQKMAGPLPELELPYDHDRPAMQSFRGAEVVRDIQPVLANAIRALSRREGGTLFMVMLSAYSILLHCYTQQQDIVIGTGVANRRIKETESLIGMIVNTLPLRIQFPGDLTFREILKRVRETTLEAYAHQDLPFEKLVEALQPQRDLSRNPLFQNVFSFHDSQVPELNLPGLNGKVVYRHNDSAKFDINIVVIPWAEQLTGIDSREKNECITVRWEYATDLFECSTIETMIDNYMLLLKAIVDDAGKTLKVLLSECKLLPERKIGAAELTTDSVYDQSACTQVYHAPVNAVEGTLASIWIELLDVPRVGRNDNFFDLGGHSLLIMQLVSRIWDNFAVQIPITVIFDKCVLSDLAEVICCLQQDAMDNEEPELLLDDIKRISDDEIQSPLSDGNKKEQNNG